MPALDQQRSTIIRTGTRGIRDDNGEQVMAEDYFLKIDGIPGDSRDNKHKDEIKVLTWSWGETNQGSQGDHDRVKGKVNMHDLTFSMHVCKASPKLFLHCATGKEIKEAILTCRKSGASGKQEDYFKIKLTDLVVSNYQTGGNATGAGGDVVPLEQIGLNFTKIHVSYIPQAKGGPGPELTHWYDVGEQTSG